MWSRNDRARRMVFPQITFPSTTTTTTTTAATRPSRSTTTSSTFKLVRISNHNFQGNMMTDSEAHLLHSNDWMHAQHFVDDVKVQRFCLTLLGEARLQYQSLEPINVDWQELENLFGQQYSKIRNTREQLFHAWRSFNCDKNTEIIAAYVHCIRQVAALLSYGEPTNFRCI